MTSTETERVKRPYLRPAQRRRHLLDAASVVVKRDGLEGLTMVAVTAEAGVSRRLLYNHFPDLPTLVRAYVTDRLSAYVVESEPLFAAGTATQELLTREAFARITQVASEDRLLLRAILAGTAPKALLTGHRLVEQAVLERWSRLSPDGVLNEVDRVRVLLLVQMGLALADYVDRGDLTVEDAVETIATASRAFPIPSP